MNSSPSMQFVADLESIREFFGAEPELEYQDVPYLENVVQVEAELDNGSAWLNYMPAQGWAELRLVGKPFSVVKLLLSDISHLSVRKTEEDHMLIIRFNRKLTSDLTLWLRPHVMLFWGNDGPDPDDRADLEIAHPPTRVA